MVGDFLIYRVLPLTILLFLTLAGGAEICRVILTSTSEIVNINHLPAGRENKQLGGKGAFAALRCFNNKGARSPVRSVPSVVDATGCFGEHGTATRQSCRQSVFSRLARSAMSKGSLRSSMLFGHAA